jgi:putative acyl-CoA dehydrogenase
MNKEPKVVEAYLTELTSAQGLDKRFDTFLNGLKDEFVDLSTLEYRSRSVVEKLALGCKRVCRLPLNGQSIAVQERQYLFLVIHLALISFKP